MESGCFVLMLEDVGIIIVLIMIIMHNKYSINIDDWKVLLGSGVNKLWGNPMPGKQKKKFKALLLP